MSDQEHNILTLARSQGLTLARCCIQTRGLSRGIKIVMDSHTILTMLMLVLNMMFLYMYVYVEGQFRRCTITDRNCIFRNIAESPTVAPESL